MRFMMWTIVVLLFVTSISAIDQNQSPVSTDESAMDSLLTRLEPSRCPEYAYNIRELLPTFLKEKRYDSAVAILAFAKRKCPDLDLSRWDLLVAIGDNNMSPSWCDSNIVTELFHRSFQYSHYRRIMFWDLYPKQTPMSIQVYDEKLSLLASAFLNSVDSTSMSHALLLHLAGQSDSLHSRLHQHQYAGTCIQSRYDAIIDSLFESRNQSRSHWGFSVGLWSPRDNAAIMGKKLELGMQAGARSGQFGGDVTFLMRVLKSSKAITFKHVDTTLTSDHFWGGYIGYDMTYELFSTRRSALEVFGGIGYDWIEVFHDGDRHWYENLQSLNLNFGATKYFFYNELSSRYFGMQARYNFVHYYTHGGTELSGNAISLNLVWGFLGNHGSINRIRFLRGQKVNYYEF